MDSKLAIIIPAYKAEYLDDCLRSIATQTNKNFNVYIGNDYSPYNIESIVVKYKDTIDIEYKKFDNNLGDISLIKQWERCIAMIDDEEWIWLFSDDDMMDPDCVESFYNLQNENHDCNVFRFNLQVINSSGNVVRTTIYPKEESAESFLMNRFSLKYDSAISNYIFSREAYDKFGFKEFPLAWCSDDASVVNLSEGKSIITIPESNVQWRISDSNISSLSSDAVQRQKIFARLEYLRWLYSTKKFSCLNDSANKHIILNWMIGPQKIEFQGLSAKENKNLLRQTEKIIGKRIRSYRLKNSVVNLKFRIRLKIKSIRANK